MQRSETRQGVRGMSVVGRSEVGRSSGNWRYTGVGMRRTAGWGMWRGGVEACVEFTRMDVGGGGNEVEGGGKIALRLMS